MSFKSRFDPNVWSGDVIRRSSEESPQKQDSPQGLVDSASQSPSEWDTRKDLRHPTYNSAQYPEYPSFQALGSISPGGHFTDPAFDSTFVRAVDPQARRPYSSMDLPRAQYNQPQSSRDVDRRFSNRQYPQQVLLENYEEPYSVPDHGFPASSSRSGRKFQGPLFGQEYPKHHGYNVDDDVPPELSSMNPIKGPQDQYGDQLMRDDPSPSKIGPSHKSMESQVKGRNKPGTAHKRPNKDEFDGPKQYLDLPPRGKAIAQERELPFVPISLTSGEQDSILSLVNKSLSECAFDFVAKYEFPIPLEPDKRKVEKPSDREWTDWAHLLKRLATKRRIPKDILYNGQIKQLVTVLENSLEMRHAAAHQSRPLKDDRNVLQLISAGFQVAKLLIDVPTAEILDDLYTRTESKIQERKMSGHPRIHR